jgi:hypothetical protein
MSVIPALRRLRQEDNEFKANLGHESRLSKKKKSYLGSYFNQVFKPFDIFALSKLNSDISNWL